MQLPIVDHLAESLGLTREEVLDELQSWADQLKNKAQTDGEVFVDGLGTIQFQNDSLSFAPDDKLAMAINSRFSALGAETVPVLHQDKDDEDPLSEIFDTSLAGENRSDGADLETESLDDLSEESLWDGIPENDADHPLGTFSENGYEDAPFNVVPPADEDLTQPFEPYSPPEKDADTLMNEDNYDLPPSPSEDPSLDNTSEWSPFFEELDGLESNDDDFQKQAEDFWQGDHAPSPPDSPFANGTDSEDIFSNMENELGVSGEIEDKTVEDVPSLDETSSWASAPLEETAELFDMTNETADDDITDIIDDWSQDNEFFSDTSAGGIGSSGPLFNEEKSILDGVAQTPEDTSLVQGLPKYGEDNEDTVFQTFPPPSSKPSSKKTTNKKATTPPKSRNPYANRKKERSSMPWILGTLLLLLVGAGGIAYWQGLIPFGNNGPSLAQEMTTPPGQSENPSGVDTEPGSTEADPLSETPATDPETPGVNPIAPVQSATAPPIQVSQGGFTVVVTSKETLGEAESFADIFIQQFAGQQVPIDVLRADRFSPPRYRVGIGQFSSNDAALNFLRSNAGDFPRDAWVLELNSGI